MRPGPAAGARASDASPMLPIDEPPLSVDLIADRYRTLVARLRQTAEAAGRDPDRFRVVAVTKGFELPVVRMARAAGLTLLGENRVQEALPKVAALPDAEWHLVGRLQANKARQAARAFAVIHSVDTLDLLRRLERIAGEEAIEPSVLLQVNVSGEAGKAGFEMGWARQAARPAGDLSLTLDRLTSARVVGLMTIAPAGVSFDAARGTFAALRHLRDALEQVVGRGLPELSMGMTADADAAVAEGATLVRIGTALFGPRPA